MATTLTVNAIAQIEGTYKSSGDLADALQTIKANCSLALTNGTGDSKSDRIWMKSASAAGASDTYDLDGGTDCVDIFGNGISFSKVRVLYIRNKSETTGYKLSISGDWFSTVVLGGTTPTLNLQPKSFLLLPSLVDGYAITAVSADQLTIDPGANTVSYDVIIIGED